MEKKWKILWKYSESDDWAKPLKIKICGSGGIKEQATRFEAIDEANPYEQFTWNAAHIGTTEHWGSWWYG